jgi:anion-transporting  ArsA/GET3 family ATPase
MEGGFRDRAERVQALLSDDATAFILVTSPRADTVAEATFFASKLEESGISVASLILNRMHPRFGTGRPDADRARARTYAGSDLGSLYANLGDLRAIADGEEEALAGLSARVSGASVVRVPFLADDVHDLDSLAHIATHLFPA